MAEQDNRGRVELKRNMDNHARDILVDDRHFGTLRWHHGESMAIIDISSLRPPLEIPLSVLKLIVEKSQEEIAPK